MKKHLTDESGTTVARLTIRQIDVLAGSGTVCARGDGGEGTFPRPIHCEWVGNLSTEFELQPPEGWAVTSKIPDEHGDQVAAVYRHLKRTLRECHDQIDRIEEMLRKSKQDNEPRE